MNFSNFKIPSEWSIKPIKDVYYFTKKPRGLTITKEEQVLFYPMESIQISKIYPTNPIIKKGANIGSGTYVENGDLLLPKITPSFENGKQAILIIDRKYAYATTEIIPIKEIKGISNKFYLFFLLLHPEIRSDLAGKWKVVQGGKD